MYRRCRALHNNGNASTSRGATATHIHMTIDNIDYVNVVYIIYMYNMTQLL